MSEPGRPLVHLDGDGRPCARHPEPTLESLLELASVGARVPGFNHDIASKLQGMMMAIDELDELIERRGDAELRRALDTAHAAMKELGSLLTANRALTRTSKPTRLPLAELVRQAAMRSNVVLQGTVVEATIECGAPQLVHALSLVVDVASGLQRQRTLAVSSHLGDGVAAIELECVAAAPTSAGAWLALAAHGLARERGELRCGAAGISVQLPVAS